MLSPRHAPLSFAKRHPSVCSCIVEVVAEYMLCINFTYFGWTFCPVSVFSVELVSTESKAFS